MPARFMRWSTSTLFAASTTPETLGLEARVAHAAPVPAEEPELALDNLELRFCRRLVAEIARYFSYQLLVTVGNLTETCMKKVDRPFVGPELLKKSPVVGRGVGDSD